MGRKSPRKRVLTDVANEMRDLESVNEAEVGGEDYVKFGINSSVSIRRIENLVPDRFEANVVMTPTDYSHVYVTK
jgi:hypothetical protein